MEQDFDVVIVGGGAAGLSGAVALARFRRAVLVIDGGEPRNAPAGHVHNFLTRDGTPPAELAAIGRREAEAYGATVLDGDVESVTRDGNGFRVALAPTDGGGRAVHARRVLVASGSRDELPDVPGLAQRWGRDVLHCPYCHGWEVRDRRIGVLATGLGVAVHQSLMFAQLSSNVVLLTNGDEGLSDEQREQLTARHVSVLDGGVSEVTVDDDRLTGVRLTDGDHVGLDAVVVAAICRARADFLAPLGIEAAEVRLGDQLMGTQVEASPTGATAVPGVYVAGNVATVQAQVVSSAAMGLAAAGAINAELIADDVQSAVEAVRHRLPDDVPHDEQSWDERYRGSDRVWSGRPNAAVVSELSDLGPGTALDAGSGEGGDAIWLASRGWRVTAADLSSVALERAARAAKDAGLDVETVHVDLTREAAPGHYDLVTSSFLHLPGDVRTGAFARLADAVAPGGTLLIVGHDMSDRHTSMHRPGLEHMGWTAQQVADSLGDGWTIDTCEARPRMMTDPEGNTVEGHDAILRAHRAG